MFGKYKLNRLLGQGGMGEVYEAYDTSKERTVALKILRQELSNDERFRNRFQRESRAAAMLEEPHVIPISRLGRDRRQSLHRHAAGPRPRPSRVSQRGPLKPERAVAIIRQIAAALDAAHAQGMIHRDVKPQNILVTSIEDFAYLIDFGIAQNLDDTRLTVAGTAIGSFAYMAPERFEDRPTTSAVDMYSLASVLYEALTGQPPFTAGAMEQVIAAHLSAPPPQPSAVNPRVLPGFDDVIARGMAKDPDDRYGSPGALGRAAQRALGEHPSGPSTGPNASQGAPDTAGRTGALGRWAYPCGTAKAGKNSPAPAATLDQPRPPMADAGGDHHRRSADPGRYQCRHRIACQTELPHPPAPYADDRPNSSAADLRSRPGPNVGATTAAASASIRASTPSSRTPAADQRA